MSRRGVLRAALVVPLVPLVPVVAACTSTPPPPPPPDPLAELAAKARADVATATSVGQAVPSLAAVAGEVAKARTEHAEVLQREVDRERPPVSGSARPETSAVGVAVPAEPGAAKALLVDGLTSAEKRIAELVGSVPRYRA